MRDNIPIVVEELYRYFVTQPNPEFWPEYFRNDPLQGHALWAFYQGLQLGMQMSSACLERG